VLSEEEPNFLGYVGIVGIKKYYFGVADIFRYWLLPVQIEIYVLTVIMYLYLEILNESLNFFLRFAIFSAVVETQLDRAC